MVRPEEDGLFEWQRAGLVYIEIKTGGTEIAELNKHGLRSQYINKILSISKMILQSGDLRSTSVFFELI